MMRRGHHRFPNRYWTHCTRVIASTDDVNEWAKQYHIDMDKQCVKDAAVLANIKNRTSEAYFKHIEEELNESEHPTNYRMVNGPVGAPQYNDENHYMVWIDQHCGACGDDYYGTVCVQISSSEYLIWDYWM